MRSRTSLNQKGLDRLLHVRVRDEGKVPTFIRELSDGLLEEPAK